MADQAFEDFLFAEPIRCHLQRQVGLVVGADKILALYDRRLKQIWEMQRLLDILRPLADAEQLGWNPEPLKPVVSP